MVKDDIKRTLIKTITWRVIGGSTAFLISFILTGYLADSIFIAVIQLVVNTVLYYFHERFWNNIPLKDK